MSDIDQGQDAWACDVPVSMPEPIDTATVVIDMDAFGFTENGLFPNLTAADVRDVGTPTYGPQAS